MTIRAGDQNLRNATIREIEVDPATGLWELTSDVRGADEQDDLEVTQRREVPPISFARVERSLLSGVGNTLRSSAPRSLREGGQRQFGGRRQCGVESLVGLEQRIDPPLGLELGESPLGKLPSPLMMSGMGHLNC